MVRLEAKLQKLPWRKIVDEHILSYLPQRKPDALQPNGCLPLPLALTCDAPASHQGSSDLAEMWSMPGFLLQDGCFLLEFFVPKGHGRRAGRGEQKRPAMRPI
jgi:hypothetical protein